MHKILIFQPQRDLKCHSIVLEDLPVGGFLAKSTLSRGCHSTACTACDLAGCQVSQPHQQAVLCQLKQELTGSLSNSLLCWATFSLYTEEKGKTLKCTGHQLPRNGSRLASRTLLNLHNKPVTCISSRLFPRGGNRLRALNFPQRHDHNPGSGRPGFRLQSPRRHINFSTAFSYSQEIVLFVQLNRLC